MYELIKQKSTGQRIIFGVIIFAFLSAVLRMAIPASSSSVGDELIKVASRINKNAPIYLDSVTKLENVQPLPGDILQYNYSLGYEKELYDTVVLQNEVRQNFIKQATNLEIFKKYKITVQARYVDIHGEHITTVRILSDEY